jgi:hypothetical protein
MSKRFHVDPNETVDIFEDGPDGNVITIRARMTVEIAGRVRSELAKRNAEHHTEGQSGEASIALLLHNILAWRGPDFGALPCTPENICALPPVELDPFIERVVNAIGERNAKRTSPNERSPATGSTSASAGAVDLSSSADGAPIASDPRPISLQLATGTPKSALRSALDGYQKRSEDSTPTT